MADVLTDDVAALIDAANPAPEETLTEMADHATQRGFPYVGPAVGQFLRTLAAANGAERVFEFGSGFGYSAAWWAGVLPAEGDVVLTDFDESNLADAREFLEGSYPPTFHYEVGDAFDSYERHEGPWDAVLVDHDKGRYPEAFEAVRDDLRPGAVVVADNVMEGPVTPDEVRAALEGEEPASEAAAGVADYLELVRDDPDFETALVPLGEGVAVSTYRPE
ncbi:O-methyltransferase [Halarchaeum sp. P4]|uniref:O-methyltransferase n=1 Tax=Halarchaeum sp. P4 TaxID=3421639 RepID=UPI003EC1477E